MDQIKITQVQDENLIEEIVSLARRIWHEYYTHIIGEAQVDYMLHRFQSPEAIRQQIREGFLYYLAEDPQGEYIGYLSYAFKETELLLSKVYFIRDQRSKGFGRQAIQFVEKIAKEKGLSKMTLRVNKHNTHSIQAYQKMGFHVVDSVIQDIGEGFVMDDYQMGKTLEPEPNRRKSASASQ